jgi:hypothetical protein
MAWSIRLSKEMTDSDAVEVGFYKGEKLEPVVGIEPTTDGLQNRCSTAELNWRLIHVIK